VIQLRDRNTPDLVVLAITLIIGFILVLSAISVLVLELVHPEADTIEIVRVEGEVLGVLVGALVGFIGGRATGRAEATE